MNKNPFRKSVYKTFKKSFSKNASLKNASRKKSIVAFLLAAALLISSVGIASASQSWDFDQDNVMYKGGAHVETGAVTIVGGESNIWRSEHAAQVDEGVAFDAVTWDGVLKCSVQSATKKFTVEIGIWDGSSFSSKGISNEYDFDAPGGYRYYDLSASQFTVPKDQWLAVRVNNTGSEDFVLITEDGCSHITYPLNLPDYPVPELPTIILMSTGLLALFGYVVYSSRRRRNGKAE